MTQTRKHQEAMEWMATNLAQALGRDPDELKREVNEVARKHGDTTMPYPEQEK